MVYIFLSSLGRSKTTNDTTERMCGHIE